MKLVFLISSLFLLSASAKNCKNVKAEPMPGCYKGRLEVKGPCMNYSISILSENFDTSMVVPEWKDETTGKTYTNVFALDSRCNFPDSLKQGDEFYFSIDSTTPRNCAVCMIYYSVPSKRIPIKVLNGPCNQ